MDWEIPVNIQEKFSTSILLAWQEKLEFASLIDTANLLESEKLRPLAIILYQTWIKKNNSPYLHAANFNLAVTLSNDGDTQGAEDSYREAIKISPTFLEPRINLGSLYERSGQIDKAIIEWRWIDQNISSTKPEHKTMFLMAMNHLGRVLENKKQYYESHYFFSKSLSIEPTQADVIHHLVSSRQKQCAWPVYARIPRISEKLMKESTSALSMLSISDDPEEQLAAARRYVNKKVNSNVPVLSKKNGYGHQKIRIGYCSSDFSLHPVSMLTVEMFELHNREEFEVYGYCWSPEDGSGLRQRVIKAMDHFTRIHQLSDEEAAKKIRADEIDILVDLQGQTAGARANMLAYRPAPIQITYLGLPATTGLPSIDYVIADRFLIPEAEAVHYSETPLYMPDVYQVSDRQRVVGARPTKKACGLPETGFIFCSFNNNYKITPEMYDVWMRILQQIPGSVLWLLADNMWAEDNLRREAEARGVNANRLVFAGRVLPEDYLARYQLADLFLDTFPFNAGTTANDALWMGCPVLTICGRSFASRMAGALLTAAKLPELIAYDQDQYQEKAISFSVDAERLKRAKNHLKNINRSGALFDTPQFVKNYENELRSLTNKLKL